MSLYSIYFSPTGGTKSAVNQIAKAWGETWQEIDLSNRKLDFSTYIFTEQDVCIIAVPSFGGRVPQTALQRLLTMKGCGAQVMLVVSYGNRAYDDTLLELQDVANACGFRVIGAVAAVAEHSIMRQYGAGRPDAEDCAELAGIGEKFKKDIDTEKLQGVLELPGMRPFRAYDGVPLKPKASKNCSNCGVCAENCPVEAIPSENPSQTNENVCISCMRCIQICPAQARSNSKLILLAASAKLKKACAVRKANEVFALDVCKV